MYYIYLFLTAFFLIFLFSTNWPVKLYHYYILNKLAVELETTPKTHGLIFSSVYSEITTTIGNRNFKIRFNDANTGGLRSYRGLEIRMSYPYGFAMELTRLRYEKPEWGDFQRFYTGNPETDSQWSILTSNAAKTKELWERAPLDGFLNNKNLKQILISSTELIIQLNSIGQLNAFKGFLEEIARVFN